MAQDPKIKRGTQQEPLATGANGQLPLSASAASPRPGGPPPLPHKDGKPALQKTKLPMLVPQMPNGQSAPLGAGPPPLPPAPLQPVTRDTGRSADRCQTCHRSRPRCGPAPACARPQSRCERHCALTAAGRDRAGQHCGRGNQSAAQSSPFGGRRADPGITTYAGTDEERLCRQRSTQLSADVAAVRVATGRRASAAAGSRCAGIRCTEIRLAGLGPVRKDQRGAALTKSPEWHRPGIAAEA